MDRVAGAARAAEHGVPAAAGDADGRDAAGALALGGDDAGRRLVAGFPLRGEHRGSGGRVSPGRVLPAAHLGHGGDDLFRGGAQSDRIGDQRGLVGGVVLSAGRGRPAGAGIRGRSRPVERVCRHRAVRPHGAGSGGRLDAAALAAARRHGLHVLGDPGAVSAGPGDRQRRRRLPGAEGAAAAGARIRPTVRGGRDRLGGLGAFGFAAVLAGQPDDFDQPMVHVSVGPAAMPVRGAAGGALLGSEFPAGAGGRRAAGAGPGTPGGGRLCREHGRRDCGRAGLQPAADPGDRQPVVAADHARARRPVGGRVPGPGGLAAAREARSDCDRARNGAVDGHRARAGRGADAAADLARLADALGRRRLRPLLRHLCPGSLPRHPRSEGNRTAQIRRELARDFASFLRWRHTISTPRPAATPARR